MRLDATRLKPACQPEAVTAGLEGQRNPRDRSLDRPPCRPPLNSAGLSAADLARAARSSWAFFASAAALSRSAKLVFLDLSISVFCAQEKNSWHRGSTVN